MGLVYLPTFSQLFMVNLGNTYHEPCGWSWFAKVSWLKYIICINIYIYTQINQIIYKRRYEALKKYGSLFQPKSWLGFVLGIHHEVISGHLLGNSTSPTLNTVEQWTCDWISDSWSPSPRWLIVLLDLLHHYHFWNIGTLVFGIWNKLLHYNGKQKWNQSINQSLDLSCNSENNWQWVVKSSFVWSNSNRPLSGSSGVYGMQGNISLKNQFACENASKICKKCTQSFKHDDEYHGKRYLKQIRIAASAWHNFTVCIYWTALPPLPLHQKTAWHH